MSLGTENGALLPNQQPDPIQTYWNNRQYNDQQQRYQNQLQQQKEANQAQQAKFLADSLDSDKFTGTPWDPMVNQTLNSAIMDYAGKIKSGASWPDLIYGISNTARQVGAYSKKAQAVDSVLKQTLLKHAQDKGIDQNELYNYSRMLAYYDENGKVKPVDQVNENLNYANMALEKYPQFISKGSAGLDEYLKGKEHRTINTKDVKNINGIDNNIGFTGEYYPGVDELLDKNGKVIQQGSTDIPYSLRLKSEPINLGGKVMNVAPQDLYNDAISSGEGTKAFLRGKVKSMGIDPDSPAGQIAQRKVLYDHMNSKGMGFLMQSNLGVNDSQREKENFQMTMQAIRESNRQNRQEQKSPFGMLGQIAAGTAPKGLVGDDGSENVTGLLPNSALFSEKVVKGPNQGPTKDAYNSINWDPQRKRFVIMDEEFEKNPDGSKKMDYMTGKPVTHTVPTYVTKDKLEPWIKNIATANGSSPEQAWKELTSHFDVNNYDNNKSVEDELKTVPKKPWWSKFRK